MSQFQSTRPRGARPSSLGFGDVRIRCFNPRARVGRDLKSRERWEAAGGVSIHAPAWGATSLARRESSRRHSFNPRARVGRDRSLMTFSNRFMQFQSTRPRGARLFSKFHGIGAVMFQSTRPRGARRRAHSLPSDVPVVSIHAPAWGATGATSIRSMWLPCFNPRARVGRDAGHRRRLRRGLWFQSTRPRGARPAPRIRERHRLRFQSTRPRGARRFNSASTARMREFQSTRPRGARPLSPLEACCRN